MIIPFFTGLRPVIKGGWLRVETQDLCFSQKVLQCACQGDAKRRGPRTRAVCLDSVHLGRQTKCEPVPSPCIKFCFEVSQRTLLLTPFVSSWQDTNLLFEKFHGCCELPSLTARNGSG